jgi:hypothetical protein
MRGSTTRRLESSDRQSFTVENPNLIFIANSLGGGLPLAAITGRVEIMNAPSRVDTRWVRLRIRAAMWRPWKTPRRRREALIELGVRSRLASNTAGSGLGPWYLAKAKALSVGLSNAYLRSLGLPSLVEE